MKKSILFAVALSTALSVSGCVAGVTEETKAEESSAAEAAAETEAAEAETAAETEESALEAEAEELTGHTLMIYCGAGMKEPFQVIADNFMEETGCEMNVTYANAGQIQSQIKASEEGDMFIAGSADELKPVADYVSEQKELVKHIPVLAVQEGNPKNITGLSDLTAEGVSVIVGDAESTPIGKIAKKAFEDMGIADKVTIAAATTTAPQMSTALAAGEADAAIVWKENCNVDGVEIIETPDMEAYIKTIPAASLNVSADEEALSVFNDYLNSDAAKDVWTEYGYEIVE